MNEKIRNETNWTLVAVAAVFTISVGFSFFGIKQCVPYADTLTILTYRYIAALIGVGIWLMVTKALGVNADSIPNRPKGRLYQTAGFYILFMIFQILSMFFATSIEGAIVYAMVPIFAKVLGRITLGERSTTAQNVFVAVTVAALIVLIVLNATDVRLNGTGLVLSTISSIFMACQNVSLRYIRGVFKPIEITACIALGGSAIFITAGVARVLVMGDMADFLEPLRHWDFILWVSFLGIFCILLTAQCMAYMLAHIEIVQATVLNSVSTLISIVAGALILGEPLCWYHYICGVLILAGVLGLAFSPADAANSGKSLGDDMS